MRKLVLVLLYLSIFSCTDNSDDLCNPECWTVVSVRPLSIDIVKECSESNGNLIYERVSMFNTSYFHIGQSLCGNEVPF